eukprot:m.435930 g.435930  ORF g.435930 m.435930 type:complete len:555 (-) comp17913_c0_seq1:127-1791(-)
MGGKNSKDKGHKGGGGSASSSQPPAAGAAPTPSNKAPRKSASLAVHNQQISESGAASRMVRQIVHVHENTATSPSVYKTYDGIAGRPIGKGGTSNVVRVTHKITKQEYALKIINMHRLTPDKRTQLLREVEIMRSLDHPNIIRIHEVFKTEFTLFIVMEFCTGGELFDDLERCPNMQMPENEVRDHTASILQALSYLHLNGIVHRDLKLENFIFTSKNRDTRALKMIDFGYSRTYLEGTYMTSVVGTAFYIAPEVLSLKYGKEADLWSLGCMVYMMVTGEIPIPGRTDDEVIANVKKTTDKHIKYGTRAGRLVRGLSQEVVDFINVCMTVDPAGRPTAESALDHPWFKAKLSAEEEEKMHRESTVAMEQFGQKISQFKSFGEFKKLALIATSVNLETEALNDLKKQFVAIDTNHTGTITHEEFMKALENTSIPAEELEALFVVVDQDHTGQIKYSEFIAACMDEQMFLDQHALISAFNALDLDGDGTITREELKTLLGPDVNDAALDGLISEADFHNDGVISKEDFIRAMRGQEVLATPVATPNATDPPPAPAF